MKRLHLFEFEDLKSFPVELRNCLTGMIATVHRLLGTPTTLAELIAKTLRRSKQTQILDLCSGAGGPMLDIARELRAQYGFERLSLTLSDLYPNRKAMTTINGAADDDVRYSVDPVDAAEVGTSFSGLRTMICSFHHMPPPVAKRILADAQQSNQPLLIYELSDGSAPLRSLWWITFLPTLLFALFVSAITFARQPSWRQLLFTVPLPILPICFAWDGAVSVARAYSADDIETLLEDMRSSDYNWEIQTLKSKVGNKLCVIGMPQPNGHE